MRSLSILPALLSAAIVFAAGYPYPSDVQGSYVINPYRYAGGGGGGITVESTLSQTFNDGGSTNPVTVNLPSGSESGDFVFYSIAGNGRFQDIVAVSDSFTLGQWGGSYRAAVFYKILDGTEGSSIDVTPEGNMPSGALCAIRVSGISSSTVIDRTNNFFDNESTPPDNDVTITNDSSGTDLLALVVITSDTGTGSETPDTGWTVAVEYDASTESHCGISYQVMDDATITVLTDAWTIGSNTSDGYFNLAAFR